MPSASARVLEAAAERRQRPPRRRGAKSCWQGSCGASCAADGTRARTKRSKSGISRSGQRRRVQSARPTKALSTLGGGTNEPGPDDPQPRHARPRLRQQRERAVLGVPGPGRRAGRRPRAAAGTPPARRCGWARSTRSTIAVPTLVGQVPADQGPGGSRAQSKSRTSPTFTESLSLGESQPQRRRPTPDRARAPGPRPRRRAARAVSTPPPGPISITNGRRAAGGRPQRNSTSGRQRLPSRRWCWPSDFLRRGRLGGMVSLPSGRRSRRHLGTAPMAFPLQPRRLTGACAWKLDCNPEPTAGSARSSSGPDDAGHPRVPIEREALALRQVEAEIRQGHRRPGLPGRPPADRPARPRPRADRGRPRPGQDPRRQDPRAHAGDRLQAHPVHPRPAARRPRRHADLRPAAGASSRPGRARSSPTLLLADEINRAPAKVQSALLEAMEERQVTLGDTTYRLPEPFLVLATQNPIEQEGTYPLAEAQVDRFMLKLKIGYPTRAEEEEILERMLVEHEIEVRPVLDRARLVELRAPATRSTSTPSCAATCSTWSPPRATRGRRHEGARAADRLRRLAARHALPRARRQGHGAPAGRGYVIPEDVKEIAADVLRHRVVPTYEAEAAEPDQRRPRRAAARPRRGPLSRATPDARRASRALAAPRSAPAAASGEAGRRVPADLLAKVRRIEISTTPPGRPGRRRQLPLGLQGPRHGVRRGAPLPAGRRRPHDRLEPHRPHGRPLRQAVRRGARPHRLPRRRRLRQPRASARARSSSASSRRRSRRCSPSPRCAITTGSAPRCSPTGSSSSCRRSAGATRCCAWCTRSCAHRPPAAPTSRARSAPCSRTSASARCSSSSPTSSARRRSRALQRAAARHDVIVVELVDPRDLRPPASARSCSRDAETGAVALYDGRRHAAAESARARGERERAAATIARARHRPPRAAHRPPLPARAGRPSSSRAQAEAAAMSRLRRAAGGALCFAVARRRLAPAPAAEARGRPSSSSRRRSRWAIRSSRRSPSTLDAADATREATFPDWSPRLGRRRGARGVAGRERTLGGGRTSYVQRLTAHRLPPGKIALPPVEIRLAGEPGAARPRTPPSLALEVRSVLPADDKELDADAARAAAAAAVPRSLLVDARRPGGRSPRSRSLLAAPAPSGPRSARRARSCRRCAELERALARSPARRPPPGTPALSPRCAATSAAPRLPRRREHDDRDPAPARRAAPRAGAGRSARSRLLRLADQVKFARRPAATRRRSRGSAIAEAARARRALGRPRAPEATGDPRQAPASAAGGRRRMNRAGRSSPIRSGCSPRLALLARLAPPPAGAPRRARWPAACRARPARAWRLHLPFYLRLVALLALVLALARPQLGYAWEESTTEGIDIQIVVDISGSMGAEDFQPKNRLEVAKQVVRDFVARRPGDRIGVTIFGGTRADPLAAHHRSRACSTSWSSRSSSTPSRTAPRSASRSPTPPSRLKDSAAKSKVVVLVTDGVNNAGEIDPLSAAAVAKGLGLRVYTIGVGRDGTRAGAGAGARPAHRAGRDPARRR